MSYIRKIGKNWVIEFKYNGKKYIRSLRVLDKKSAQKIQAFVDYQIAMGQLDPNFINRTQREYFTVGDLVKEYLKYINVRYKTELKPKTYIAYKESIDKFLKIVGDIEIRQIDSVFIEKNILPEYRSRYAKDSVRHHLGAIRTMFNKATDWKMIDKNPFLKKVPRRGVKIPRYFKEDEIKTMREYFSKKRRPQWQGDIVFFCMNTGLRRAEAIGLDWFEHIDLVNEQMVFKGKGSKQRMVPLNAQALQILKNRKRHIKDPRVFWEIDSESAVSSMWRRMIADTKLKGRFHDLRATFASYYAMAGGSLDRLKEILGHSDYRTVEIYRVFSPDSLQRDKNIVSIAR